MHFCRRYTEKTSPLEASKLLLTAQIHVDVQGATATSGSYLLFILCFLLDWSNCVASSGPFPKEAHQHHSGNKSNRGTNSHKGRRIYQLATENPISSPHFHQPHPEQNTSRQRV